MLLDQILLHVPCPIFWKNLDGAFLGCNQVFLKGGGFREYSELIGKVDAELPWKKYKDLYYKDDQYVIHTRKMVTRIEYIPLHNRVIISETSKTPLIQDGQVIGILGIALDITDRKQAQELRLKNTIMQEKMKTIEMLAGSIAHELRTPLGSIRMDAETLVQTIPQLLKGYQLAKEQGLLVDYIPPNRLKNIEHVVYNIRDENIHANSIINMLLTNIRNPEVNQKDFKTLSIQASIHKALQRYPFISEAQRHLVHFDQNNDFNFQGIELLLEHVFFNLCKNALYYIEDMGKGEIFISLKPGPMYNKLYFKDTGKGIAPDILPTIFERFTGTRHHGTGIGLAFCKEVMHEFGGHIECESVLGEYTIFVLSFPTLK